MTTTELWRAVGDLAAVWRRTDVLARYARDLPENAPQRSQGLPGMLQVIVAGSFGLISNPLILASRLPLAASVAPEIDEHKIRTVHSDWLEAAHRVESAHRLSLAWLRARLPGYPLLLTPLQLVPGAPLTTSEFTYRLIWQRGERAAQLHTRDVPPAIAETLLADTATARALMQATRDVAAALINTPEWNTFEAETKTLDDNGRAALRAARSRARERLAPAAVDAHGSGAVVRYEYREHVIRDELQALTGTARSYVDAFAAADGLVEMAVSSVFGQIACYYPIRTMAATDLELVPGVATTVRYSTPDVMPAMPSPGMIAWLEDPLVTDAVRIRQVNLHFQATGYSSLDITANVLANTGAAWRES